MGLLHDQWHTYGGDAVQLGIWHDALIPVEVDLTSPRVMDFNEEGNADRLKENLDLLDNLRENAVVQLATYQRRISHYYNERVYLRTFQEGDLVLRKTAITNALKEEGKLRRPNWEGPYKIMKMLGPNTSVLETLQGEVLDKTWNTMHLKRYLLSRPVTVGNREDN